MASDLGPLDRLTERAETLAGAWAARARASTTVGRERALLRMFGVSGLDAAGRPLAWAVVDRYLAGGHDRLGGGIVLPFAMALAEYDLDPQRLALDVARAVRADANEAVAATPILACSASVQPEVRREALDAGCDAFEGKPFDTRSFADLLLGLIARRAPG